MSNAPQSSFRLPPSLAHAHVLFNRKDVASNLLDICQLWNKCYVLAVHRWMQYLCYVVILGGVLASFAVASVVYLLVTKPSTILMKKTITAMRKRHELE